MPSNRLFFCFCLMSLVLLSAPLMAQDAPPAERQDDPEAESFNLQRDADSQVQVAEEDEGDRYEPAIEGGKIEASVTLGFLNFSTVLWQQDQILYKYDDQLRYWGDVAIKGQGAFNPILRLGYNLTSFFAVEGIFSVSFSEYTSEITRRVARSNETGSDETVFDPPLGEFDAENRSLVTIAAGLTGILYPLNFSDGEGRFHPYLVGGFSRMWYDMNSNYTDSAAVTWNTIIGGGFRLIADDLISLRLELTLNINTLQFTPAENFDVLDEGTRPIPLTTYPTEERVTEYDSQDIRALAWGIGFVASF